jgi:hypothetical protein
VRGILLDQHDAHLAGERALRRVGLHAGLKVWMNGEIITRQRRHGESGPHLFPYPPLPGHIFVTYHCIWGIVTLFTLVAQSLCRRHRRHRAWLGWTLSAETFDFRKRDERSPFEQGQTKTVTLIRLSHPGRLLLLAAIYFIAAKLSLLLAIPPGHATAVWPPSE